MSTIVKHNRKTWTDSERVTEHIYQEQFYLEIHHNDKKHEQTFVSSEKLGITTSNAKIGYWESWEQFESTNDDKFYLTYPINIAEDGNYWVELAYHSSMEGTFPAIFYMDGIKEDVQLKGSNNFLTRFTKQYQLQ
ncbi:MAG: hypothetical protein HUJ56_11840, partial [Erysipelotrichaceae bacterium]|nr:hypothetical protein [Erysipelotrichaceae bacterium]